MSNIALHKKVLEAVACPEAATDGLVTGYTNRKGFSVFKWPGTLTVDLENVHKIRCVRLLIWDGKGTPESRRDERVYHYRLLTSLDLKNWTVLYDSSERGTKGWQVINIQGGLDVRYVRVHGMWNSANSEFHVVELEAHDEMPAPLSVETAVQKNCNCADQVIEEGDGFPIESDMRRIISRIEQEIAKHEFLNQNLFVDLFTQLRTQVADVAAIERSMDAIRREITEPVKAELAASNKLGLRYGRWTVIGCIVGGFLGLTSIVQNVWLNQASTYRTLDQTVQTSATNPLDHTQEALATSTNSPGLKH